MDHQSHQQVNFSGSMGFGNFAEPDGIYHDDSVASDQPQDANQYILPLQGQPEIPGSTAQYSDYDGLLGTNSNFQVSSDNDLTFKTNQQITFNMPGAFKESNDNMEVDESPPFTIELELFYDPILENGAASTYNDYMEKPTINPSAESDSIFNHDQYTVVSDVNQDNQFDTNSIVPSQDERLQHSNSFVSMNNVYNQNQAQNQAQNNYATSNHSNGHFISSNFDDNHLRTPSIDSYRESNSNSNLNGLMAQFENGNGVNFHHPNMNLGVNYYVNELSPLTTTTSLTPSVNSIHSTQPSFFSANQYFSRNSLDESQSHRTSFDVYSKKRQSMDSQSSNTPNQRNQRYTSFTNSITNYIPFMNDKDKNNQRASPPSPSQQPSTNFFPSNHNNQQSKHLIRSIFKGNNSNNTNNMNGVNSPFFAQDGENQQPNQDPLLEGNFMEGEEGDNFLIGQQKDESEVEVSDVNSNPKAKRSKRSLFTRFKTPVKTEPLDEMKQDENDTLIDNNNPLFSQIKSDNASSDNSLAGNISFQAVSRTPSNNGNLFGINNLQNSTLNNSNGKQQLVQLQSEPDYAALFENVGKRKNIVNPSSYIKTKPKVKNEGELNANTSSNNSNSNTEKSSILNVNISHDNDRHLNLSISSSNASSLLVNGTNNTDESELQRSLNTTPSTPNSGSNNAGKSIASASKRILGSKMKSKKKSLKVQQQIDEQSEDLAISHSGDSDDLSQSVATIITKGVEVEVDLKSLDLPANTKIFPSSIINSKSRIRGRKENKEADMVDQSKIYLCNFCSRRFKRQEHLKRHFRSLHTFEKPYDCPICNKKFSRSDNLNQHLKIHKQEEEEEKERSKLENEILY